MNKARLDTKKLECVVSLVARLQLGIVRQGEGPHARVLKTDIPACHEQGVMVMANRGVPWSSAAE